MSNILDPILGRWARVIVAVLSAIATGLTAIEASGHTTGIVATVLAAVNALLHLLVATPAGNASK